LEAEGKKQSAILEAEGEATAKKMRSEADAKAIEVVANSAEKNFTQRAEKLKRLDVVAQVLGGNSTKFVLPANGEIVSVLNLEGKGDNNIIPVRK